MSLDRLIAHVGAALAGLDPERRAAAWAAIAAGDMSMERIGDRVLVYAGADLVLDAHAVVLGSDGPPDAN